jgi:hypothetical protein
VCCANGDGDGDVESSNFEQTTTVAPLLYSFDIAMRQIILSDFPRPISSATDRSLVADTAAFAAS